MVYVDETPVLDIAARWDRHPSRIYARLERGRRILARRLRAEGLLEVRNDDRADQVPDS